MDSWTVVRTSVPWSRVRQPAQAEQQPAVGREVQRRGADEQGQGRSPDSRRPTSVASRGGGVEDDEEEV
jgi:hypothetical protein